jgi:hypothetical protein
VTELRNLLGGFDVAFEQRHAAKLKLARQRAHLGRDCRRGQAADQQLPDLAAQRRGHDE